MEWSKEKTLKLIELLQMNASLWNTSLCDTRRVKQKRREELRVIAEILRISVPDATKKIQHLRTQYNRESAREVRAYIEDPNDRYISNWYAFDYLHFLKDSNKPYRILHSEDNSEVNGIPSNTENAPNTCKLSSPSPPHKNPRLSELPHSVPSDVICPRNRDEFSVFGEYVANELRSLKGEKNLLVAKKKIQDVIFEMKMGMINEPRPESMCTVFTHTSRHQNTSNHSSKLYSTQAQPTTAHIEPLPTSHVPPTSGITEILISNNSSCHYPTFKVDTQ